MKTLLTPRYAQSGSVLLAMALVLVVSASFVLVSKLNANARQFTRLSSSLPALNQAKAALIGYAVTYPENVNPARGPGYLPCPDLNNNGNAEGACALAGPINFTIGRFPHETLDTEDLRDSSGERLWYAISDNYRNFAGLEPLNSDTPGELNVDGAADIVAVILAPGAAVTGQNRATGPLNPANYLEGDNADADINYVSQGVGQFNDVLVTITRQELMQAVEKRVLGDVAQLIATQQTAHAAFPWPAPFANPSTSVFRGQPGTWQGHIPYHWSADPDSVAVGGGANIAGRNPFSTSVAVRWDDISGATITTAAVTTVTVTLFGFNFTLPLPTLGLVNTVSTACLNDIDFCDEGGLYPAVSGFSPPADIDCTWTDLYSASCDSVVATQTRTLTSGACPLSTITRTYTIDFPNFNGNALNVTSPTTTDPRRRDVSLTANAPDYLPVQNNAITITETFTGQVNVFGFYCLSLVDVVTGSSTSSFDATTEGSIAVNGIHFDIDLDGYAGLDTNLDGDFVDPGEIAPIDAELPSWFVINQWNELLYLSYASGEPLPGDTTAGQDCISLVTACITVDADGLASNNVRALAVSAGVSLPAAGARPSANPGDYFEQENAVVDDLFMKDKIRADRNDQTRIIATAP